MERYNTCNSPWLTYKFRFSLFFRISVSTSGGKFQLFRFPDLHLSTNMSNKLVDRLVHVTCERVRVQFLSMPTTLFLLYRAFQHGCYLFIKMRKLHDAPFHYIVVTTKPSMVQKGIVNVERYVVSKEI